MSSKNNIIILLAVLITTASAIGLYVYLDTNSSEPINPQTGSLASEPRSPSSMPPASSQNRSERISSTRTSGSQTERSGNMAPSSTAQGTASVSTEELLEKKEASSFQLLQGGKLP